MRLFTRVLFWIVVWPALLYVLATSLALLGVLPL